MAHSLKRLRAVGVGGGRTSTNSTVVTSALGLRGRKMPFIPKYSIKKLCTILL